MPAAWLARAERRRASRDGGWMTGGAPRVVWHTTETDPGRTHPRAVAHRLDADGVPAHLVWNPLTGVTIQMIPVTRAALGLGGYASGAGPGREGRLCVQIQVAGFASQPFTMGPLRGLEEILRWLDAWRVPRSWPAGSPPPAHATCGGDAAYWSLGGHFGHSQVPGATHDDPGAIDITCLLDGRVEYPKAS